MSWSHSLQMALLVRFPTGYTAQVPAEAVVPRQYMRQPVGQESMLSVHPLLHPWHYDFFREGFDTKYRVNR